MNDIENHGNEDKGATANIKSCTQRQRNLKHFVWFPLQFSLDFILLQTYFQIDVHTYGL